MGTSQSTLVLQAEETLQAVRTGHNDELERLVVEHPKLLTFQVAQTGWRCNTSVWHCAAAAGNLRALTVLAERLSCCRREIMLDLANADHATPFMVAAANGHSDCAALLLQLGSDPWILDCHGYTAMHLAAARGHAECVKTILKSLRASQQRRGMYRLHELPTSTGLTAMHLAAASGHSEVVEVLLECGACYTVRTRSTTPDEDLAPSVAPRPPICAGSTPLHVAAARSHVNVVLAILRHQAQLECSGRTDVTDARRIPNACKQMPIHLVRPGSARQPEDVVRLRALLDPEGPCVQQLLSVKGAPRLTALATVALQKKLLTDVSRCCERGTAVVADKACAAAAAVASPDAGVSNSCDGRRINSSVSGDSSNSSSSGSGKSRRSFAVAESAANDASACTSGRSSSRRGSTGFYKGLQGFCRRSVHPDMPTAPTPAAALEGEACGGDEQACELCFESMAPGSIVRVGGCHHAMCSMCAQQLVCRISDKPSSCPFCRRLIASFT